MPRRSPHSRPTTSYILSALYTPTKQASPTSSPISCNPTYSYKSFKTPKPPKPSKIATPLPFITTIYINHQASHYLICQSREPNVVATAVPAFFSPPIPAPVDSLHSIADVIVDLPDVNS
ncbi:hypothetical protein AOQ84DRAFT_354224 [Glonium stellatum]|uniref:Uncharacterized protein n=1 Tax=Glonium stellatum TaxID=574774 RepID=A0A8E2F1Z5_9PEZI|nr:hypothetical protein AOQ84DRAFT_354224 [Glonium stellatum]